MMADEVAAIYGAHHQHRKHKHHRHRGHHAHGGGPGGGGEEDRIDVYVKRDQNQAVPRKVGPPTKPKPTHILEESERKTSSNLGKKIQ